MGIEFGWWKKDEDGNKFQVSAVVHGGKLKVRRYCPKSRSAFG